MPGYTLKAGCFEQDNITALSAMPQIVVTNVNAALGFASFNAAIPLLPVGHAAGTYRVSTGGTVTTTITTATSWAFTLGYTEDQGAGTLVASTSSTMTAGTNQGGSVLVRSTGATALTVTLTAASAAAGVVAYTVIVERVV